MLTLTRYGSTPFGTFGEVTLPSGAKLFTVERPWAGNQPRTSCIPEGIYTLRKRTSPIVDRTSGGKYKQGWEVCDVVNRSLIMIHAGNTMDDLLGCIAPGTALGMVNGKWAVSSSRPAMDTLMAELEIKREWTIDIRWQNITYP
jgi:hypothetical protein